MNLLVPCAVIRGQYIVYVKNIIVILVIGTIVMARLRGFRQNPSRIMCNFVLEGWIANAVRLCQLCSQAFQRLNIEFIQLNQIVEIKFALNNKMHLHSDTLLDFQGPLVFRLEDC